MFAAGFLAWEGSQGPGGSGVEFIQAAAASPGEAALVLGVVVWCGLIVNAVASFLQVGGQQAIGPARAQVIYAVR